MLQTTPRTLLFVPGDRPARIAKAASSSSEAVVVDLEDAVAETAKADARKSAVEAISGVGATRVCLMVRTNGLRSPHLDADLSALVPVMGSLAALVVPKVEDAAELRRFASQLCETERAAGVKIGGTAIVATIETAAGVLVASEIAAASERVLTLLFGAADLSAELNVTPTPEGSELSYARSAVVLAAAAAGVSRPIDGPYLHLDDGPGLRTATRVAKTLGYAGKAVIHPSQLDTVASVFAPTADELEWARAVETAFTEAERVGRGAVRLRDGTFVDYPVVRRAREILAGLHRGD